MILYDPGLIYRIISDILRNKHMNIKEEDMSKSSEVRSVIYDLLKTNGNCTLEEVKKESANRGIELDSKSNTIGLAMGQLLKKDPNIKRTGRGAY